MSGDFYFKDLPAPVLAVKTNSDGRFSMTMPSDGAFALAARGQRKVIDETETYFWLIKLSMSASAKQSVMLSNDNLTSSSSPLSLVKTVD